ncbi:hypothetical protein CFOL_v3_03356 [Cephalotus follicularis]|uniref:UBN2_2 domain-containing protein n=1 Tax=Cephalotus follicularis TaxID=3775 RepID=A0A1Q3AVX3_CEPFO|nr:hypothetical protein CFOL_v3_03356 [Cephalotus follicularis]
MRLVLTSMKLAHVMTDETPKLGTNPSEEHKAKVSKWMDEDEQAQYLAIAGMVPELQRQHEKLETLGAILFRLKELYGATSRTQQFNLSCQLFTMKMNEGDSVN